LPLIRLANLLNQASDRENRNLDVTANNMSPDGLPDRIGPDMNRKQTFGDRARQVGRSVTKKLTTRQGLLGEYDYAFLFRPNLPFMTKALRAAPFFGLNDKMPVVLALLLGFQHALAMLAGIITPPLIMSGQGGVNLSAAEQQYLVSTSLIVCGILSSVQITRFHIRSTP
jgi:uric acid-xanthine permease